MVLKLGPFQHHMCGCRWSGISYPNSVTLLRGGDTWPTTMAWVMRHQPEVLSTSQSGLVGMFQADLPVPTKAGGKWKLPLALLGFTQTSEQKNQWMDSTGTMLSYWMREAALCNIRALDTAWEDVCSDTWLLSLGFLIWKMRIILSVLFPLSFIVKIKIW